VESEADLGNFETVGRVGEGQGPPLKDPIQWKREGGDDVGGGTGNFLYLSPIHNLECMETDDYQSWRTVKVKLDMTLLWPT